MLSAAPRMHTQAETVRLHSAAYAASQLSPPHLPCSAAHHLVSSCNRVLHACPSPQQARCVPPAHLYLYSVLPAVHNEARRGRAAWCMECCVAFVLHVRTLLIFWVQPLHCGVQCLHLFHACRPAQCCCGAEPALCGSAPNPIQNLIP